MHRREGEELRLASVVAVAVLAAMVLLPPSGVFAGPIAGGGDRGSPWGMKSSPGAGTQEFRYPATEDFVENQGQLRRSDIFFYTTSGRVQVGFVESAVLVKIVEREPVPGRIPMQPHSAYLSPPDPSTSRGVLVRIAFEGSHPVRPEGVDLLPHRSHYFLGNDPAGWRTDVPHYGQVVYRDLYDGVDVAYRIGAEGLKYDITVRPGSDLGEIELTYEGVEGLEADDGGLFARTGLGDLFDSIPRSYQGGEEVACRFDLRTTLSFGFDCVGWDASLPLVIDPLLYSTFLGGGGGWERGTSIAVDASGNAYVAGWTPSMDFPTTPGAFDPTYNGDMEVFVTKLNAAGSGLLYSTFLGGRGREGETAALVLDASGSAYVTGGTGSADFPTTPGAFDTTYNGNGDAFVTKLDPTGSGLLYSTFLGGGGGDSGGSVEVDASGNAYVTGYAGLDFPSTAGAFDTTYNGNGDAFVTKLNAAGSDLLYSTFLGGGSGEGGDSVALDASGSAYVTGWTNSAGFPTTPGAFDTTINSDRDAFVTKLDPTGSGLLYSTFLGNGVGSSLAVDASGSAYVTGDTGSADFPTTPGAFDTSPSYSADLFVTKLNATGSGLLYSTFLGGGGEDSAGPSADSIAVDVSGSAYLTGTTWSADFPTTPGAFDRTYNGSYGPFVTKFDPTGSSLLYSTFLGGDFQEHGISIAVDASGSAYVTGEATTPTFPTTPGAFDTTYNGGWNDAFVSKLSLTAQPNSPPLLALASPLGGEVWIQGITHAVMWTAWDNWDLSTSLIVFMNYTSSAGSGPICGPVPGSPGTCDWTVPNIVATDVVLNGTVVDAGGLKGWDESGPFTIQPGRANAPPTADAGPDQQAFRNLTVILDGTGSSDPNADPLTYSWSQLSGPEVNLSGAETSMPTFFPAQLGAHEFQLSVEDGGGWDAPETIAGSSIDAVEVAADLAGNAIAVYAQAWNGVWARRYELGSGWDAPTFIGSSPVEVNVPQIAMNPSGNAFVVWKEWNDPISDIWANRYVPGVGWDGPTRLESSDGNALSPRIAVDPAGNAVAVWTQADGSNNSAWASRFDVGSGWDLPSTIETNPGSVEWPDVGMDLAGNAIATWRQMEGSEWSVWANRFVPGLGWGTAAPIESGAGEARRADVVIDSAGNSIAVWRQWDGASWSVVANRYVMGGGWGSASYIETAALDASTPIIAVDPAGNAIALYWLGPNGAGVCESLWATRFTAGVGWESPFELVALGSGLYYPPEDDDQEDEIDTYVDGCNQDVALDSAGNAIAVWSRSAVFAARYVSGTGWGDANLLSYGPLEEWYPRLAVDSGGNATVVWRAYSFAWFDWMWVSTSHFQPATSSSDTVIVNVVNRAPTADAGPDLPIVGTSLVYLDGTGSFDPDVDAVTFLWSQVSGPDFPPIYNATSALAEFVLSVPGTYAFDLLVSDPYGGNDTDRVNVYSDRPPTAVANASPPSGFLGTLFLFDATGSTDDVGITEYRWDFGDAATDTNPLAPHAYAARGAFTVSLTVWDTAGQSDTDNLTIQIENRAPTASATATAPPIFRGQIVVLDGTGSYDPDRDPLTYSWRRFSGPPVTLTGANTATAGFVPTELGTYVFNLTVDDGFGGIGETSVTIPVLNRNPIADAGPDQSAAAKHIVLTLDASASSDPDGDPLAYAWTAPLEITLSDPSSPTPTFTATTSGMYTFLLQVDDGLGGTATDDVVVVVLNAPPVAVANAPATAAKHAQVPLDGTASSDPDGDALTYNWTQVSGPFVTINGPDDALAAFTPAVSGTYEFQLTVDDGDIGGTHAGSVVVVVLNAPPVARATATPAGKYAAVTLDGSASSDADGDALTYRWAWVSGPPATITDPDAAVTDFTPTRSGTYLFQLTVNDGDVGGTDTTQVAVSVANAGPVADAGPDILARKGDRISLAGSAFDGDGDALAVSWSQVSGPASVTLSNGTTMRPDFVAQAVGVYIFRLEATDTEGAAGSDEVAVTVWGLAPTAVIAASPTSAGVDASITFEGSGSRDLDGTIVDYAFDFGDGTLPVSGPSPAQMSAFSTPGLYTVSLIVTDDDGNTSAPATVQVLITPPPVDDSPPTIAFVFPLDGATRTERLVTATGTAWDDRDVVAVEVSLDGVTWIPAQGTTSWSVALTLPLGASTIHARAFDAAGNIGRANVSVTVSSPVTGNVDPVIPIVVVIIGAIIAVLWRLRVVWFPYLFAWLYSKLRRDDVLDNFTRGEIYAYVRLNPGDTYADIKRNLGLSTGPLTYHLAVLEREELIRSVLRGSRKLFYPRDVQIPENGGGLHALQTRILTALREDPGIAVNELAAALGVSRQVALYHVRKLVRADLARLERRVRGLRAFPNSDSGQ